MRYVRLEVHGSLLDDEPTKGSKYSDLPASTRVSTWLSLGRKILRAMLIQTPQALNRIIGLLEA